MLASADREGSAGCREGIGGMDQTGDLAAVVAPTRVVAGADDPVTPPSMGLELQAGIGGASLSVLAPAAHLTNIEQPGAVSAAIVDHLAGSAAVRGDRVRRQVLGDEHVERGIWRWAPA
jgi:3-oxoadipate enol-lactonase / 4-carboxymuconolactone decarboxylase